MVRTMPKSYEIDMSRPVEIGSGIGKVVSTPKSMPTGRIARSKPRRNAAKQTGQTTPV